jgi:hypothetical protein
MIETLKRRWQSITPERRRIIRRGLGLSLGAAAGFTWYATVGCASGTCPITSNPFISTAWGGLMGVSAAW